MSGIERYDAVVIGAGQGGAPLAMAVAGEGKRTALVERDRVGGTCVNYGCTPTKTMVASARAAWMAGRAADYGIMVSGYTVDMEKIRQRKRDMVESFRSGSEKRITGTENLELIRGAARFTGRKTLAVACGNGEERSVQAEMIFINTGAGPAVPSIQGLDKVGHLDSTTVMELDRVPEHLVVIGGGYIGLEFGQMFRRFGSRVTIVQRGPRLMPREDPDVSEALQVVLESEGVEVLLNAAPSRVAPGREGGFTLEVVFGDETIMVEGSHLLVAAGRRPNTGELLLHHTGVETDARGHILVNDRLETGVGGIYALGDVKGGPAFTHISYDDYRILFQNLFRGGGRAVGDRPVPYTLFTDPQLGRVGMSERQARKSGGNIKVANMPMTWSARALETGETRGMMKAVVDADSGRILGAAVLGIEGGEIMAVIQVAMTAGVPYTVLRDGVFAHPTLAESLNTLFGALE
jgi:pyruvate/2-oxoglutarate dehydrogenase complex dihydrolipoamide dehydrogenase (E3) component